MAIAYRGITSGIVPGDLPATNGRILAGLQRLATFQHSDGMFSIWCGGEPGVDITSRVAHRLLGLRGLPYPDSEAMLGRAGEALLTAQYHDNSLLPLDGKFRRKMASAEDAVAYYFAGERIQITIAPKEQTIAPLARLFLPGNLALLKGGANAQTAHLPIERQDLTVDAVAVRPGKGKLYVSVHDMYDADKVGTVPGIEITVE